MVTQLTEIAYLPTSLELPESDDTPVDNEIQNLIPNLLKSVLAVIWEDRHDWFFGVDMGLYDRQGQQNQIALVPDGFLSLNVTRVKGQWGRSSYVLAEEEDVVPIFALEIVSRTYGEEYGDKMTAYANLGVLYYAIYNPQHWRRDGHAPLEIYRLGKKGYKLQKKQPLWMPEIGLGIGAERGLIESWEREWLYWYDQTGNRYEVPEEMLNRLQQRLGLLTIQLEQRELELEQERQRSQLEARRAEQAEADLQALRNRLQAEGIDPDQFLI